ncbi:MAG: hypothetical protein H7318_11965 [Oligoflexus sp.]|nr:hypothetical protein [Oligoflexus sp.]
MNTPHKGGKKQERRTENRCAFIGEIPGRLVHQSHELKFLAVDVSKRGLGILLDPCPAEGEEILVEFDQKIRGPLRFTIKHIYEGASIKEAASETAEMQRCGIELTAGQAPDIDLIEIFTRYVTTTI